MLFASKAQREFCFAKFPCASFVVVIIIMVFNHVKRPHRILLGV